MLFLHTPSKLGLSSPVGAAAGRFSVDQGGIFWTRFRRRA